MQSSVNTRLEQYRKRYYVYVTDAYYVMMNVQQDHGHQRGQQVQQGQRDPKGKREKSDHNKICRVSYQI